MKSYGLMNDKNQVLVRKGGKVMWVSFWELLESHSANRIDLIEYSSRLGAERGKVIYGGEVVAA